MKKHVYLLSTIFFFATSAILYAQQNIKYGENYVVFEAEDTSSPLTKWAVRTPPDAKYYKGDEIEAINQTYLEYTGAWAAGLNPGNETELKYTFTCPKSGEYRMLMRLYQPLAPEEAGDQKNDVFVRLEGSYTSATIPAKTELEKNHKFWGRGVRKWGSCHKLEIGGAHYDARYGLTEGEEYTFYMSGRSGGASIDYILFYEDTPRVNIVNHDDLVYKFPEAYRPSSPAVAPTVVSINAGDSKVRKGTSFQLQVGFEPENAIRDVVWSSSDALILSVDQNGLLTAKGDVGQMATITVSSELNELSASVEISIVEWFAIAVESITISPEERVIPEQSIGLFTALTLPVNADNPFVVWSSSDENVASVDQSGKVTAIIKGQATIRATSSENNSIFGEATVVVDELVQAYVKFDDENKYLNGEFESGSNLTLTGEYHAGTAQTLQNPVKVFLRHIHVDNGWNIVKDVIIELNEHVGKQTSTFTASIPLDGVTPSANLPEGDFYYLFVKCWFTGGATADKGIQPITITKSSTVIAVTSISLDTDLVKLTAIGETYQLVEAIEPTNAEDKSVKWISANPQIASVNETGMVTAVSFGETTITANTTDGGISASAQIIVEKIEVLSPEKAISIQIYPNPATGWFSIKGVNPNDYSRITIYNTSGRLVYSDLLNNQSPTIRTDDFEYGLYMIKLNGAAGVVVLKLIVL